MTLLQKTIKRSFDIVLSAFGLILLWPLILVCAVVSAIDCGGFGIFRQRRVGRNGTLFNIYKIRTMSVTKTLSENTITISNDKRITRSGRIMRKLKFDELPQLLNVLVGDMSFVGPRPDVPGYADKLTGTDRRILGLRPGITGPATIKYSNEEALLESQANPKHYNDTVLYPDKVRLNLEYLNSYSTMKDVRYILVTVRLLQAPNYLTSLEVSDA